MNEALLRVRRLLRSELQAVVSLSESLEGQDGSFSGLQAVQLLQQEQLLPGAAPASEMESSSQAAAAICIDSHGQVKDSGLTAIHRQAPSCSRLNLSLLFLSCVQTWLQQRRTTCWCCCTSGTCRAQSGTA